MTKTRSRAWPDYAAVWRWHFYAGLFCIPFVLWLALTGSVYLFRTDIEGVLDRPYENLHLTAERALPSQEVEAAVAAVTDSHFSRYEPPATPTGAAQVVVSHGADLVRVYVHPTTLKPMKVIRDDLRPMEVLARLHSSLLMGQTGSIIVEVAASWAIVLILTGLFLWFPRGRKGFGGVLYPRLSKQGRILWRDMHGVTGLWVSAFALFLLLSGLPWSAAWGNYLTWARSLSTVTSGEPDWPVGGETAKADPAKSDPNGPSSMPGMTAAEMAAMAPSGHHMAGMSDKDHEAMILFSMDTVMPTILRLDVPRPVWVLPPAMHGGDWTVSSQSLNRPTRVAYTVSGADGHVVSKTGFADQNIVDKVVNVGVAGHVGHLFGRLNQAILLLTAIGLIGMMVSAIAMWMRRKPDGRIGAPRPVADPRLSGGLVALILVIAVIVPLFGLTLVAVLVAEHLVLRRVPRARDWLGLRTTPASA